MTLVKRFRFPRLVVALVVAPAAVALAIGTAAAASAAPSGGYPYPTPTPTVLNTTPPDHHHHNPRTICLVSLEQEHDALPPEFQGDQGNQGNPYGAPSYDPAGAPSGAPVYGDPNGDHNRNVEREAVEVVQLVRVCVTEVKQHDQYGGESWGGDRNRDDDVVTVTDLTGPFAWVVPVGGIEPTPNGLPSGIEHMLTTR